MASFNRILIRYETCVLRRLPEDHSQGIVKRSGVSLTAGERGNFDKLVSLLGQSGWSLKGIGHEDGQELMIFERAMTPVK